MSMTPEDLAATRPQMPEGITAVTGGETDPVKIAAIPPVVPPNALSPTKLSYEQQPGWMRGYLSVVAGLGVGMGGFQQAVQGNGVGTGTQDFGSAKKQVETSGYLHAVQDQHDYANGDGYTQWLKNFGGGWLARQIPSMDLTGPMAALSLTNPILGAVAGQTQGPKILGQLAQQAPEFSAVATGMGAGFLAGGPPGAAIVGGAIMAYLGCGHTVYNLMDRGVDLNTARVGGLASGILTGYIGTMSGGATGTALSGAAKGGMENISARLIANMKVQIPATLVMSLQDSIVKFVATHTAGIDKPYTLQEGLSDLNKCAQEAFVTAPVMAAVTEGSGRLMGAVSESRFVQEERGSMKPADIIGAVKDFKEISEEAVAALQKAIDRRVEAKRFERNNQALGEVVKRQKLTEDQAHFEESIKTMDAQALEWFMQKTQHDPELHARLYRRWLQLTGNAEHIEQQPGIGSDAPGIPIDADSAAAANEEMGFGKPARQLSDSQKETEAKVDAIKKELPPAAEGLTDERNQEIVATYLEYLKVLKGAAPKVLAAARNAQAEGREMTPEEQAQLDRATFLDPNKLEQNKARLVHQLQGFVEQNLPWSPGSGKFDASQRVKLRIGSQFAPETHDVTLALDTTASAQASDAYALMLSKIHDTRMSEATNGLSPYQLQTAAWHAAKTTAEVDYTDAHGDRVNYGMRLGSVAKGLALFANADARVGLTSKHGNAFTTKADKRSGKLLAHQTSTEEAFESALSSAKIPSTRLPAGIANWVMHDPLKGSVYLQMIEGVQRTYDDLGDILKSDFERLNPGKTLKLQPKGTHGGPVQREGMVERTHDKSLKPSMPGNEYEYEQAHAAKILKDNPGYTIERHALERKIVLDGTDLFGEVSHRIRSQANWAMVKKPAELWDLMMNHPHTKPLMESRMQGLHRSLLNGYIDAVSGRNEAQGRRVKMIDNFMASTSITDLWGKPGQFIKHGLMVANGMLYTYKGEMIPPKMYFNSLSKYWGDNGASKAEMSKWDEATTRYADRGRIGAYVDPDSLSPRMRKWQRIGMKPFPWGDARAYFPIMAAVRDFVLLKGGTEEQAHAEATDAAESFLASSNVGKVSDLGRHPVVKMFKQYFQPSDALGSAVHMTLRQAANFPTKQNKQNAVRAVAVSNVAAGMFILADVIWSQFFDDKQKREQKMHEFRQKLTYGNITYPASEIVTGLDTGAYNLVRNDDKKIYQLSTSYLEAWNTTMEIPKDFQGMATDDGKFMHHVAEAMTHVIRGPAKLANKPIPEHPFFSWFNHVTADHSDGVPQK